MHGVLPKIERYYQLPHDQCYFLHSPLLPLFAALFSSSSASSSSSPSSSSPLPLSLEVQLTPTHMYVHTEPGILGVHCSLAQFMFCSSTYKHTMQYICTCASVGGCQRSVSSQYVCLCVAVPIATPFPLAFCRN